MNIVCSKIRKQKKITQQNSFEPYTLTCPNSNENRIFLTNKKQITERYFDIDSVSVIINAFRFHYYSEEEEGEDKQDTRADKKI